MTRQSSRLTKIRTCAAATALLLTFALPAQAAVILDNTINGTNPLGESFQSITTTTYQARIFTTPNTGTWALDAMKMALYSTTGAVDRTITIELKAVNGSNNPTGAVLATESFLQNITSTPAYYDFDLTDSTWNLVAGTTYALIFRSDASTTTTSWTQPLADNTFSMSEGFVYVATRRSINSGASWVNSSYNNGLQLSATAVPEPSTAAMIFGCVALGAAASRRRRKQG